MTFALLNKSNKKEKIKDVSAKRFSESDLVVEKAEIVLEEVLGHEKHLQVKPLFLKNRTLTVTCDNSVIAPELMSHQQEIIDKINLKLEKKEVDRIRYLV